MGRCPRSLLRYVRNADIKGDKFGDEKFKLDPTKNPKHIYLATVDDNGKPLTFAWHLRTKRRRVEGVLSLSVRRQIRQNQPTTHRIRQQARRKRCARSLQARGEVDNGRFRRLSSQGGHQRS